MKVTIVVDNIEHAGIPGEWGFCAYIAKWKKAVIRYRGIQSVCRKCRKIKYRFKKH